MLNKCVLFVDEPAAWRAPVAGFIAQFLLMGYVRSCSLLLLGIGEDFDVPKSLLLSTAIIAMATEKLLGTVAERICHLFGGKCSLLVSTFLATASFLICYLLPMTGTGVVLTLGVGIGIAGGLAPLPVYSATAQALKRRRALGISVVKCGVSVGAMVFPPLLVYLINEYGARGTLIILAGIMSNGLVAMVLIPSLVIDGTSGKIITPRGKIGCLDRCRHSEDDSGEVKDQLNPKQDSKEKFRRASFVVEKRPLRSKLPLLIHYCGIVVIAMTSFSQMVNVYPMFANEMRLSPYVIAAALSLQSVVDLVARFAVGLIIDRLKERSRLLMKSFLFFVSGSATLMLGLMDNSSAMAFIFCVIFGVGLAQMAAGWIPILAQYTDVTRLPLVMSLVLTSVGVMSLIFIIFIKKIVDAMDTYKPLILIYGGFILFCSLNALINALLFYRCRKEQAENEKMNLSHEEPDEEISAAIKEDETSVC